MSDKHIDQFHFTCDMPFDKCLFQLQIAIRSDTMKILSREHEIALLTQVEHGLETMRTLADATLQMATGDRSWAERDRVCSETEKIRAETEKIRAQVEKSKAKEE